MLMCELDVMEYAVTMESIAVGDDYLAEDFFDYEVEDDSADDYEPPYLWIEK